MPRLLSLTRLVGVDPVKGFLTLRRLPRFFSQRRAFRSLVEAAGLSGSWREGKLYPCLADDIDESGTASGAYFHQDLYVAQKVFADAPRRHIDLASRVDGFVAHVASFRPIEVIDIRPLSISLPNITFRQANLMELPPDLRECADSVSCLHALEHFGLGRYGDPLDPDGHRKGFDNLAAMVKPGGRLYVSVPIGPQRYEFNAHRVFAIGTVLEMSKSAFTLEHFSYVDDRGDMHRDVAITDELLRTNAGCIWGCGIYVLRKVLGKTSAT
jgi:SAM-dependent methyltransferase